MRICAAAVCLLNLASALNGAGPTLVTLAVSEGKDIRFVHRTNRDGLSPGTIRDILQDDQGFLWFNTSGTLNRYDGYDFKSYRRDSAHPNYPGGGFLPYVFKDRSGFLWVCSNESLDRFDPATETSIRYPIDRNGPHSLLGPVRHISQDRTGILWVSTDSGLHRMDTSAGTFRHYSHNPADPATLSTSVVRSTYEDRNGTLWVCTGVGLDVFDRRSERVTERVRLNLTGSTSIKALEDRVGMLWIIYLSTGSASGLASWDRRNRRLTNYSFGHSDSPTAHLSGPEGIHEDADGNLWLATRGNGLVKIDPTRRHAVRYRHSPLNPGSISEDMLMSVFEDHEGNIWVGAATTGLNQFQTKPLPFKRYRHEADNQQSLLRTSVTAVYADSQENVWVGSSIGLTRIDGKTGEYKFFRKAGAAPANLSNTFVLSIVEDRSGYLWFGTYGGLNRYDPRTGRFAAFRHNPANRQSLSHDIVSSLMVDRQGILWAGTADGLNRCEDPAHGRFRSWKATAPQDISAMVEDSEGVLWLTSGTLQRFDPAAGRFTAYGFDFSPNGRADSQFSTTLVRTAKRIENAFLTIDRSGLLWMATANGLVSFDRKREQFSTYTERDGLPASSVHGILEDVSGNLWVSTAGGLSRFDPRAKTFTNYYEADGLAGTAFEGYPAACRSRQGQMFFGSKSGLTSFWPDEIIEKPSIPPIVLTGFFLRNEPVGPGPASVLAQSITFTRSLTLPHEENMFSFQFATLSYVDPPRNQYRYMLEPLDSSWRRADADHRLATFTTLPAGKYTLRIQGSNNRGVWNEQGIALQLQILPPWWATWWFRAICTVLFVAMAWGAWQLRMRQVLRESQQLRDVIETIPGYVWSALPDGSVDFINRRWLEFSGFAPHQALRWGWVDALHPDDRARFLDDWGKAFRSGEPMEAEARVRNAEGQYRWLLIRSVPQRDATGKIVKWYGKSTDIDDRKRAEETLRESEARFRAFVDHATDAFFMMESETGTIIDVNRRACESLGYTREDLIGKTAFHFDAGITREWFDQYVRPRVDGGETVTFETSHRRKDGTVFPVEIRARSFQRLEGRVRLSLALDITERKRLEEERERLRELETELAHINRVSMMGELAASIAHEVNQPLSGVVSNGSACLRWLAGDRPDIDEVREAVRDIVRDGKRAGEIIARIRALTKRAAPPKEKLDLNDTVREVLALIADEAKRQHVLIGTQFADDLSPVSADRVQLQQVILNLIMNAIEAMSSIEDRPREVIITTRNSEPDQVQVSVQDSGPGLDPTKANKIFEPFFTTKVSGMGMGLSITRSIVQNHGGRIWAVAKDSPGAMFHVSLPKYQQEEHAGAADFAGV